MNIFFAILDADDICIRLSSWSDKPAPLGDNGVSSVVVVGEHHEFLNRKWVDPDWVDLTADEAFDRKSGTLVQAKKRARSIIDEKAGRARRQVINDSHGIQMVYEKLEREAAIVITASSGDTTLIDEESTRSGLAALAVAQNIQTKMAQVWSHFAAVETVRKDARDQVIAATQMSQIRMILEGLSFPAP